MRKAAWIFVASIFLFISETNAQSALTPPQMPISAIDDYVNLLNRAAPFADNPMSTILSARRKGRTITEEIALSHHADEAIFQYSETELKRMIVNGTTERYCSTNLKQFMNGNVSFEFVFYLRKKEFFRLTRTPLSCTMVN